MLQLEHVRKSYTTNAFTQVALDDVSLAFRDNEFVSILGPSGSGKTTMLNVIGGLDHFDSGDLLIDGISTREYRDRDWDAYRNNRIGFVFQSYNLIPHQTILANVELALTLSGVSPAERRERARQALADVGLGEHVDKRPSQLSGGQMQRVAIARALINDPEILLADEPTGALDSRTSVQVMDLLREVAADRLVIMVTHNPEFARQYSTRIVELADGRIRSDSDPYAPTEADLRDAKPARRTSMSFLTALSLSFNNLMTKKGRTLMTAFAGSIGIIGIAAILALANGVNAYIQEVEEETLSVYPLQIMSSGFDMTSMLVDVQTQRDEATRDDDADAADAGSSADPADQRTVRETRMVSSMFGSVGKNDLAALKRYLDKNGGDIDSYVQDIEYLYGVVPQIYSADTTGGVRRINPDSTFESLGLGGSSSSLMSSSAFSTNVFSEMPADLSLVEDQFDVKAGRWPKAYDELVLVLSPMGTLSDFISYAMGLRDHAELESMVQSFADQEELEAPTDERTYTYRQLLGTSFKVVPTSELYVYEPDYGVWASKTDDEAFMRNVVGKAHSLKIVGVVQRKEDVDAATLSMGIYYTPELTSWLMEQADGAKIVQEQLANPSLNVMSGKSFDQEAAEERSEFDMGSLFSIDQDKLAGAFGMDASKLDLSGLDLSGLMGAMDLSGVAASLDPSALSLPDLDLSQMQLDLPALDLSGLELDLSDVDLSGVDVSAALAPEVVEALTPSLAGLDVRALFEGVQPVVDRAKLQPVVAQVGAGLQDYLAAQLAQGALDPTDQGALAAAVSDYLSQPEVSAQIVAGVAEVVSVSDADRQRLADNLRAQLESVELTPEQRATLDDATQALVGELARQVGSQVADKLADQLAAQLSGQLAAALSASVSSVLETYLSQAMGAYMASMASALQTQLASALTSTMQGAMTQVMSNMASAVRIDEEAFVRAFEFNMDQQELAELMMALMSTERTSYDNNLAKLGYASEDKPSEIDIYPKSFDDKAEVISILDAYNERQQDAGEEDKVITYTDIVGALMTSVTDIVNMISYVLIAFVAISLVVSSIMIGVITYISVLERKKEIGILRSIGASKRDVSNVFNAETIIEGLVSGVMGVGITALACIPANVIVEDAFGAERVARLPLEAALVLVGVSVLLSFVAGVLPARKAAKADPVEALRSE